MLTLIRRTFVISLFAIGFLAIPVGAQAQTATAPETAETAAAGWVGFDAATGQPIDVTSELALPVDQLAAEDNLRLGSQTGDALDLDALLGPRLLFPESGARIGELPGAGNADAIIGTTDDRSQVWDTTAAPFRGIVFLYMEFPDGATGTCSGTLVKPRTVLTAAHCVYGFDSQRRARGGIGWASRIAVFPGRNGQSAPFGGQWATRYFAGRGWATATAPEFDWSDDWGLIELSNRTLFERVGGTFDTMAFNPRLGDRIATTGYPGDKPQATMWHAVGRISEFSDNLIKHDGDIMAGESGGPCWYYVRGEDGWSPTVIGVNSHEFTWDRNGNGRFDFGIDTAYYNACAAVNPGIVSFLQGMP